MLFSLAENGDKDKDASLFLAFAAFRGFHGFC